MDTMKTMPDKDGNTAGTWDSMLRFHPGRAVTHTSTTTPSGPDYCQECSDAAADWVRWPCVASKRAQS